MTTLLNIRLIQIKRELNDAGPGAFLIAGLLWFLIYTCFTLFQKTPEAYYLTGFLIVICLWLQLYRKDKAFVYNHINNAYIEIYIEYIVLVFPFSVSSLLTRKWMCFPVLLVSLLAIPLLKYTTRQKTYLKNISSLIPARDFEWISGIRKSFAFLVPLYMIAIAFSWFKIFPLLLLWFISVSIASFYNECEPLHILKEGNLSAKKFIEQKMLRHSKYLVMLYTPILIINTIFNFDYWLLNLLFIPAQILLLCFSICLKYSNYQPNKNPISTNIILSLTSLGALIPYFLPIPLFLTLEYSSKAKNNLNNYLND